MSNSVMTLAEALKVNRRAPEATESPLRIFLVTGFEPLHLLTFLRAHLRVTLAGRAVEIQTGLFEDLSGSLLALASNASRIGVVAFEWADFDARLGIRTSYRWQSGMDEDICAEVVKRSAFFLELLSQIPADKLVVISPPTLPFFSPSYLPPARAGRVFLSVQESVGRFISEVSRLMNVRVINADTLNLASSYGVRFDPKATLMSGFPYQLPHASVLGGLMANLVCPRSPKKGLITDLDNTLWNGILGEDGMEGVSWDLDRGGQVHGLYQMFLGEIARAGVLMGVASKNDPQLVKEIFARRQLALDPKHLFPIEAGWGEKSEAVSRILRRWNIGAGDVVFVDDSPMELAEVKQKHPDIECIRFPQAAGEILDFLRILSEWFGRDTLTTEDSIRSQSIRNTVPLGDSDSQRMEFLKTCDAVLAITNEYDPTDSRPHELINKTNQFNLNGVRYTKVDLDALLQQSDRLYLAFEYADKFGPLGRIAVLIGQRTGVTLRVTTWVMSCRAFSRNIEYRCLEVVFEHCGIDVIEFDFATTPRNSPFASFLSRIADAGRVTKKCFHATKPEMFHKLELPKDGIN